MPEQKSPYAEQMLVDLEAYVTEPITPRRKLSNVSETGLDCAVKQARISRASSTENVSALPLSRSATDSWVSVNVDLGKRQTKAVDDGVEEVDVYEDPFSDYSEHASPLQEVDGELDSPTDPDLHEDDSLQRRASRRRTLAPTTAVKSEYSQESWAGPSPTASSLPKLTQSNTADRTCAAKYSSNPTTSAFPQQEAQLTRRSKGASEQHPVVADPPSLNKSTDNSIATETSDGWLPLWRHWQCWEPFLVFALLLVAAIIANVSVHAGDSSLSTIATVPAEAFGNASRAAVEKGQVRIGYSMWCSNNGTENFDCGHWQEASLIAADGSMQLPNSELRVADSAMLVLSIFATMLAAHYTLRMIAWVAILQALDLPLDIWRKHNSRSKVEEAIGQGASQTGSFGLMWTWWGLDKGPIAAFFTTICSIASVVALAHAMKVKASVSNAKLGQGAWVPLILLPLLVPSIAQTVPYILRLSESLASFSAGPQFTKTPPPKFATGPQKPSRRRPSHVKRPARPNQIAAIEERSSQLVSQLRRSRFDATAAARSKRPSKMSLPSVYSDQPSLRSRHRNTKGQSMRRSAVSALSKISEVPTDASRWIDSYAKSTELRPILTALRSNEDRDPFVLSDEGLLYIYIDDPDGQDMEVPRLVPPEGVIRKELMETAAYEGGLEALSRKYWWESMQADCWSFVNHCDVFR